MTKPQKKTPVHMDLKKKMRHKRQKMPTLTQRKTLIRREQVHYLILTEGLNANQIATKLNHDYHTIKTDVEALTEDSDFWLDAQVRAGWVLQTKNIIASTFEEIKKINEQLQQIETEDKNENFNFSKNPYNERTETADFLKYAAIEGKAYAAFLTQHKHYGEYAQLQTAITHKKRLIKEFMEDLPLYHKTQELERWIEAHQRTEEMKAGLETAA